MIMSYTYIDDNPGTKSEVREGFTLVELLVVIAILGTLSALLLPAISRSKDKGRETVCRNNLRQLATAFVMYGNDNSDAFPAPGSRNYGHKQEDWLWWQLGLDANQSAISPFVSTGIFMTNLYQCPADFEAKNTDVSISANANFCRFSYSLTSFEPTNGVNLGLATLITGAGIASKFHGNLVNNSAGKILLLEEERDKINDARWVPRLSTVTKRHNKRGNAAFCDGHVATVDPKFGFDIRNSLPSL